MDPLRGKVSEGVTEAFRQELEKREQMGVSIRVVVENDGDAPDLLQLVRLEVDEALLMFGVGDSAVVETQ